MRILAFDTATDAGSVAIVQDGKLEAQTVIRRRFAQSRNLVQTIDFLLRALELDKGEIDGIAVSIGPGSYTGLRIGLSIAKGLTYSWEKPLLAVNSLDALAQHGQLQDRLICPLIRFRKDEYYGALYRWDGGQVERQSDYLILTFAELLTRLDEPTLLLGILREEDLELLHNVPAGERIVYWHHRMPEAYFVALLGEKNLRRGLVEDVQTLTPFYMHEFPLQKK